MYSAEVYSAKAHHQLKYCGIVVAAIGDLFEQLDEIVELSPLLLLPLSLKKNSVLRVPPLQDGTDYFPGLFNLSPNRTGNRGTSEQSVECT